MRRFSLFSDFLGPFFRFVGSCVVIVVCCFFLCSLLSTFRVFTSHEGIFVLLHVDEPLSVHSVRRSVARSKTRNKARTTVATSASMTKQMMGDEDS